MAEIFLEVKNGIDETANSFADYLCRIIMNHLENKVVGISGNETWQDDSPAQIVFKLNLSRDVLFMTDRIKDLFKTSNGKYIAPQQIETVLGADKYIEQIAVIGNNRNFVTAIIAPNIEAVKAFANLLGQYQVEN